MGVGVDKTPNNDVLGVKWILEAYFHQVFYGLSLPLSIGYDPFNYFFNQGIKFSSQYQDSGVVF